MFTVSADSSSVPAVNINHWVAISCCRTTPLDPSRTVWRLKASSTVAETAYGLAVENKCCSGSAGMARWHEEENWRWYGAAFETAARYGVLAARKARVHAVAALRGASNSNIARARGIERRFTAGIFSSNPLAQRVKTLVAHLPRRCKRAWL